MIPTTHYAPTHPQHALHIADLNTMPWWFVNEEMRSIGSDGGATVCDEIRMMFFGMVVTLLKKKLGESSLPP